MCATYSRIVIAPLFFILAHYELHWASAVLFMLASLTDWLDGYLARKLKAESTMGQLMDPIADKILILSALLVLLDQGKVDSSMIALLISRDIYIGGIRSVAAANQIIISAKAFGKWKTALQMLAIPCLFLSTPLESDAIRAFGYYSLWLSVGLSLISGIQYNINYFKSPRASQKKRI